MTHTPHIHHTSYNTSITHMLTHVQHNGDLEQASEWYEKARKMDLADRYLNTKSSVYLLRADKIDQAVDTVGLFTKEGEDPVSALNDMQCAWFEQESAEAYLRLGNYGKALKRLLDINKVRIFTYTCAKLTFIRTYTYNIHANIQHQYTQLRRMQCYYTKR